MRIGIDLLEIPAQLEGIGVYAYELLRALAGPEASAESDEYVLFVSREGADRFDFSFPGLRRVVCPVRESERPLRIIWEQFILPLQAWRYRLDLLHGVSSIVPLWAPCPQVVTVHDLAYYRINRRYPMRFRAYVAIVKRSIQRAHTVIAVSSNTKRDIVDLFGVDPDRVVVIHNGHRGQSLDLRSVERLLRSYDLTAGAYLLHVGRVEYNKNVIRLLEAYAKARQRDDVNVPLVLAGRGTNYMEVVWSRARELGIESFIRHLGYVPDEDLIGLYNGAIALVFPSLYEGFGLPVVEAMGCGTPVIASNRGSIPEVVGDAAILVDPESPEEMARAIGAVVNSSDLRMALESKGSRQADLFSWTSAARATKKVYKQVLGRSPGEMDIASPS